jgi:hypothetical protein
VSDNKERADRNRLELNLLKKAVPEIQNDFSGYEMEGDEI